LDEQTVRTVALLALLAVAAVWDVRTGQIPNWLTYPAIVLGLALGVHLGAPGQPEAGWHHGLLHSLGGFAVGFVPLLAAFLLGGYGGGDAKLMGAVGAIGGAWLFALYALFYSLLASAALGVLIMIWRGQTWAVLRRVFRALWLLMLFRRPADPTPEQNQLMVRFAVGALIGVGWLLAEQWWGMGLWEKTADSFDRIMR